MSHLRDIAYIDVVLYEVSLYYIEITCKKPCAMLGQYFNYNL